jgi:Rod binding domain-containing protein
MEPVNTATARSYLDFEGLGQLKGQARQDGKAALRETAQQFEGMFLQMMLKSMRESTVKSDLVESSGAESFEAMFDKEVSVQLAKRNMMGVADMLVASQSKPITPITQPLSTAELLQSRAANGQGLPLQSPAKSYALDAAAPSLKSIQHPGGAIALPKAGDLPPRTRTRP